MAMQCSGVMLSHPFLDTRVLTFGLSLQRKLRQEPGRVKPLLAEAIRGLLPD